MAIGIQETKEGIVATFIVGKFVIDRLKDGVQLDDANALASKLFDEAFRNVVLKGIEGADKIPSEIKDISFTEFAELVTVIAQLLEVPSEPTQS